MNPSLGGFIIAVILTGCGSGGNPSSTAFPFSPSPANAQVVESGQIAIVGLQEFCASGTQNVMVYQVPTGSRLIITDLVGTVTLARQLPGETPKKLVTIPGTLHLNTGYDFPSGSLVIFQSPSTEGGARCASVTGYLVTPN